jgi:hypothetical protein
MDSKHYINFFFTDSGVKILRASHLPDYIFIQPHRFTNITFFPLASGIIPINPTKSSVKFKLSNRTFNQTITQLPVVPAFSITTDKSQGLTFQNDIIDSQKNHLRCRPPTQILYVALSRVTDPNKMKFTEKTTLEYLNQFKPTKELIDLDKYLRTRSNDNAEFF